MSQISVSIDGKMFRMACEDGQEAHLEALAGHLDGRIAEMRRAFGEIGDLRLVVMAAITIVDEFFDARRQRQGLAGEITEIREESSRVSATSNAREQEIAAEIDKVTQRLERIVGLLGTRTDL